MAEYYEQLQSLKDRIPWKIILTGDERTVISQTLEGFYEELSLTECKMRVREQENFECATPSTINNLVQGLLEDRERVIAPDLFRASRRNIVGFKNGVFDLQTGKLRGYSSHDFVLNPLPHTIPENVDIDIEAWFDGILMEWVTPDVADWFKTVLAYFLFIYPNSENLWMNFFESGRNGKSSCLKLLEKIVGDDKVIGCDLAHINRFSNATFHSKWLVLGRDSASYVSDAATSFIKNYSGDEKALVEVKGGASYDTYTTGKIIVSTNNLIQSKDRSFGWYRRLIPIPFPNTFPMNEDFEKNLFKRIPDIVRIFLHRAYCYRKNQNTLSKNLPKAVATLKEETRYLNDRVAAFWELKFFDKEWIDGSMQPVPVSDQFLKVHKKPMSEVYEMYSTWHHDFFGDGNVEPSLKSFGGPYGAFLTHAKPYLKYERKRDGRYVEIRENVYDDIMNYHAEDSDPDAWFEA